MHNNLFFRGLLLVVAMAALWYSALAAYRYYNYTRMAAQAWPESIIWEVKERADDDYIMEAFYTYHVQGKAYSGSTAWPKEFYRNRRAAEDDKANFTKQYPLIWFDAFYPEHSTLQKNLPIKESIIAVILWALLLYFAWLGFYVAKFKG